MNPYEIADHRASTFDYEQRSAMIRRAMAESAMAAPPVEEVKEGGSVLDMMDNEDFVAGVLTGVSVMGVVATVLAVIAGHWFTAAIILIVGIVMILAASTWEEDGWG